MGVEEISKATATARCPFCKSQRTGVTSEAYGGVMVRCSDCRAQGPIGKTHAEALDKWNVLMGVERITGPTSRTYWEGRRDAFDHAAVTIMQWAQDAFKDGEDDVARTLRGHARAFQELKHKAVEAIRAQST